MKDKIKRFLEPKETYMQDFRKRIKWFFWISGIFIAFMIVSVVASFMGNTWEDSALYILYFLYLSFFCGFNWWRYHQNSVVEEKKHANTEEINDILKTFGIDQFDHKKGRRSVAKISCASIILNIIMIIVHLTTNF